MRFRPGTADRLSPEDLAALITDQVPESAHLEYKRELPGTDEKSRVKFVDLIAAMANSGGGTIIYGVEEAEGGDDDTPNQPTQIVGIPDARSNYDSIVRRLTQLIDSHIAPKVSGLVSFDVVDVAPAPVFSITVRRSWMSPHLTSVQRQYFPVRTHALVRPLDWHEIRDRFIGNEAVKEKIERFRNDRFARLITDPPAPFKEDGRLLLILHPLSAVDGLHRVDLEKAHEVAPRLVPNRGSGSVPIFRRYNLDGLSLRVGSDDHAGDFLQIHRSGIVEFASVMHQRATGNQQRWLEVDGYEPELFRLLPQLACFVRAHQVDPPFVVMLSLAGLQGARIKGDRAERRLPEENICDTDTVLCPDLLWDGEADPAEVLRPAFDMIWNACGYPRCLNYDEQDRYIGRR